MQPIPLYSLGPSLAHPPAATHIPTITELFYPQETHSSDRQVQLKQPDPFPAQAGGKAPAPGDEVGRSPSSQAWEQPVSYGKGAMQGRETSLAPAWM